MRRGPRALDGLPGATRPETTIKGRANQSSPTSSRPAPPRFIQALSGALPCPYNTIREETLAEEPKFSYGGQAVIEGVMIRGRRNFSIAVRRQDGTIANHHEALNTLFTGKVRQFPLVRGVLVLLETLMLGVKALQTSTRAAGGGLQQLPPLLYRFAAYRRHPGTHRKNAPALQLAITRRAMRRGP